ncbi:uncharacterized protein VTP21DRAFT_4043 [Calcarisporiella thermophila]|uniref:uncharacterized protein n=1 Tax=Calcarisporiella thermophila TaxID=911321 RepID=UPI003743217E
MAEISHHDLSMTLRRLRTRLVFARLKAQKGWEHLDIGTLERKYLKDTTKSSLRNWHHSPRFPLSPEPPSSGVRQYRQPQELESVRSTPPPPARSHPPRTPSPARSTKDEEDAAHMMLLLYHSPSPRPATTPPISSGNPGHRDYFPALPSAASASSASNVYLPAKRSRTLTEPAGGSGSPLRFSRTAGDEHDDAEETSPTLRLATLPTYESKSDTEERLEGGRLGNAAAHRQFFTPPPYTEYLEFFHKRPLEHRKHLDAAVEGQGETRSDPESARQQVLAPMAISNLIM